MLLCAVSAPDILSRTTCSVLRALDRQSCADNNGDGTQTHQVVVVGGDEAHHFGDEIRDTLYQEHSHY